MSFKHINDNHLPLKERLLSKRIIDSNTGCWLYTGALDKDGYGKIKVYGTTYRVSRVSYTIFVGAITEQILHKPICPNRHCFNPDHLYDGSHSENMSDRACAGRYNWARARIKGGTRKT